MSNTYLLFNLASKSINKTAYLKKQSSLNQLRNLHQSCTRKPANLSKLNSQHVNVNRHFSFKARQLNSLTGRWSNLKKLFAGSCMLVGGGTIAYTKFDANKFKDTFNSETLGELLKLILGNFVQFADCEEKPKEQNDTAKKNRTAQYEETLGNDAGSNKADPLFDWHEFLKLIYQEKFYFLAAVVVS